MILDKDLYSHLEYMITDRCNMSCSYCFERNRFKTTIAQIDAKPYQEFSYFGGEPLLMIDEMLEWSQLPTFQQHEAYINTNGLLIADNIEKLKQLNIELIISLDGPEDVQDDRQKGSYPKILEGIKLLAKTDIPWSLQATIPVKRHKDVHRILTHLLDLIDTYNPTPRGYSKLTSAFTFMEEDATSAQLDELLDQFYLLSCDILNSDRSFDLKYTLLHNLILRDPYSCGAGVDTVTIAPNNEVHFCHRSIYEEESMLDPVTLNVLAAKQSSEQPSDYWYHTCTLLNKMKTGSPVILPYTQKLFIEKFRSFVLTVIPQVYY